MAQWNKCVLTKQGEELIAQTLAGGSITFTRAQWGIGDPLPLENQPYMQSLIAPVELPAHVTGALRTGNRVNVGIRLTNDGLENPLRVTECALFARNPESNGDVLFGYVSTLDGRPMDVDPASMVGNIKTVNMTFIISTSIITEAIVSADGFLTLVEAQRLFAALKHRHRADEVDQDNGSTVEVHQKTQDDRLDRLEKRLDEGITTGQTVEVDTKEPLKWRIVNHNGWYDRAKVCFRA